MTVERDILEKNDRFAAVNRRLFAAARTLALNLVSSPGSGKTTLLVRTLRELRARAPLAVIEGDQQTSLDADRIKATGVPAVQINTGKMCHLDASMIAEALGTLPPPERGVLFIENVGNLRLPGGLRPGRGGEGGARVGDRGRGQAARKYPDMFHAARVVLVTKVDLLPTSSFDVAALEANVRSVNPRAQVLRVSRRPVRALPRGSRGSSAALREVEAA